MRAVVSFEPGGDFVFPEGEARRWRDAVNRHGGDVAVVHLPESGVRGNTHFPMSDLNNVEVADPMSASPQQKGLDR